MESQKLPDYYNSSTCVYQGKRISLYTPEIQLADGKSHRKELVAHPGAVVILPFFNKDNIILIRNYRVAIDKTLWELPAGTLEPEEPPHVTAHRELIEETGYEAKKMTKVMTFYTTPGFTNEQMHAYIAEDLTFVGQDLEENEQIEVVRKPFTDAIHMIKSGEIQDAKTIALLLFMAQFER